VFCVGAAPRLYNEDLRQLSDRRESLETQSNMIEKKGKKGIRLCKEDFMYAAVALGVVYLAC
jgi:hypothetical protein